MVVNKSKAAFRTIAEVADMLGVGTHVLRFWETKFTQIKPLKMNGGRRYYRPDDVKLLECIQKLLHSERYTIEGVQKLIKNFVGNTILDDLFAEELSSDETSADNASSLSNDILKNVIEELSSIKSELQKVI